MRKLRDHGTRLGDRFRDDGERRLRLARRARGRDAVIRQPMDVGVGVAGAAMAVCIQNLGQIASIGLAAIVDLAVAVRVEIADAALERDETALFPQHRVKRHRDGI